jgi:serine/threonine-protein kinase
MGVVYRARHEELGRDVALKMLRSGTLGDSQRRARFRQETTVIAQLPHPNIVPIYDVGEQDGCPWFAMELAEGGSLAARLAVRSLPMRDVAMLVRTLAEAVQAAHERGVIHRDLKPGNVLLAGGKAGLPSPLVAKISDFGIAKQFDAPGWATESDAILGTPNYMAPEQAAGHGKEVGPATDVYALGAILYECLTGRPPFRAASVLETLEQVRTQEPMSPRRLQPGVPRDLETICLKCLAKEPRPRYARASELAEDLQRYLDGRPIRARRAGAAERLLKWARRKPALAALAGVCLLALGTLVAGAAVYERRLQHSLQETSAERERADANYREARDTLQQVLARANARTNAAIPKLQELRREQQEDALAFFLKMAEQQGDNADVRFDVARAHHQVGLLYDDLGRREEAVPQWRLAEKAFAALAAESPQRGDFRFHLANTLKVLGARGDLPLDQREDRLRRALALAEELVRGEPGSVPLRSAEADIRITLGNFDFFEQHKAAAAEDHYRRAAALYEALKREQPEASSHPLALAKVYVNLSLLLQQGKGPAPEELSPAREFHDKAQPLLEQLRREQPDNNDVLTSLGYLRVNWAFVQSALGQRDAALADMADNVKMMDEALRREPNHAGFRDLLDKTHGMRGQLFEEQRNFAEAADELQCIVERNLHSPKGEFYRLFLALALARAGQHSRAVLVMEDWTTRVTRDTPPEHFLHGLAVYCVALEAVRKDDQLASAEQALLTERYGKEAVALLRKLQERDYFKDAAHAESLRTDEDLRPLRERNDFRQLLSEVEKGKQG